MKNHIHIFIFLCLFAFSAEAKKTTVNTELVDARLFLDEVDKIKKMPNLLKSTKELNQLIKDVGSLTFYFKGTATIKRDPLISGERIIWFQREKNKIEVKLNFRENQRQSFELVEEFDYIEAYVKLVQVDKVVYFDFIRMKVLEPFDPNANMINFHSEFEKFKVLRNKIRFSSFVEHLSLYSQKNKTKIGFLSGIAKRIEKVAGQYVMTMEVNSYDVKVTCHSKYTNILSDLDMNTEITMVALLQNVNDNKQADFIRGCLIDWIGPLKEL